MSERQKQIAEAISKGLNGITSADRIAARLGYKPARNGRLAVTKTLRSMEAVGLVHRLPPEDQWDHADWALSDKGKELLSATPSPQPKTMDDIHREQLDRPRLKPASPQTRRVGSP